MKSERKNMTDGEYKILARQEAASYGRSVPFWIRDNSPEKASRLARLAARWGLKVLGRPDKKEK